MKKLILFFALALCLFSCQKPYEEADFRCLINGKEFVASNKFIHASFVPYPSNYSTLYVSGRKMEILIPKGLDGRVNVLEEFMIHSDSIGTTMKFKDDNEFEYSNDASKKVYNVDISKPNGLTILEYIMTKDGYVKGTFFLTAKEKGGTEILNITDGYFNAKFED